MKLLLVSGSGETPKMISAHAKPLGFELVWYNNIIKAMDNIDEIDPSCVVISASDFPRLWKTMAQFVRSELPAEKCQIILLAANGLDPEDRLKAMHLAVCGIVPEEPKGKEIDKLKDALKHCINAESEDFAAEAQTFSFVFTIPGDITLITGEVKDISASGLSFLPDNAEIKKSLKLNMELSGCSLRAGDMILSPVCRLEKTDPFLEMKFLSFQPGEQKILNRYLSIQS